MASKLKGIAGLKEKLTGEEPSKASKKGKRTYTPNPETMLKKLLDDEDLLTTVLKGLADAGKLPKGASQKAAPSEPSGTQIVPETGEDGEIILTARKNRAGEVIGQNVNFITVNDEGEVDKPIPAIHALFSGRALWSRSTAFAGHPNLETMTWADGKPYKAGRMYASVERFVEIVAEANEVTEQHYC